MINSLFKDSHITQSLWHPKNGIYPSQSDSNRSNTKYKSEQRVYFGASENSSVGKSVTKPVEISFSGLAPSKGAEAVGKAAEKVAEKGKEESKFVQRIGKIIDNSPRIKKFLKNDKFKKFLTYADDNQVTFGAAFALILTGLFRPLAIIATPSSKKNVDDKKYAAAQSISSGLIGLAFAIVFSNPISDAVSKVFDEDKKVKDKYRTAEFVTDKKSLAAFKVDKNLVLAEAEKAARDGAIDLSKNTYKQMGDLIPAIPKAIFTVAIIPIILKHVFGLEKHKNKDKDKVANSQKSDATLNFESKKTPRKTVSQKVQGGVK